MLTYSQTSNTQASVPKEVRLAPNIEKTPSNPDEVTGISLKSLSPFLKKDIILDKKTLDNLPRISSHSTSRLLSGNGDIVYVKGTFDRSIKDYDVYRLVGEYKDPDTRKILGYHLSYVAQAHFFKEADPALFMTSSVQTEIRVGNVLLPKKTIYTSDFAAHAPQQYVQGKIIEAVDSLKFIGLYHFVTLNVGTEQGIDNGTVLRIYSPRADLSQLQQKNRVSDVDLGLVMVVQTYPHSSFAIVIKTTGRRINVGYPVANP